MILEILNEEKMKSDPCTLVEIAYDAKKFGIREGKKFINLTQNKR